MKKCFLLAAAAAFALVACNKEPSGPSVDENSKMYMQFSIRMLSTKSSTDAGGNSNSNANPDTEVGKDYEIIITNFSGLYRYRILDVVHVTGMPFHQLTSHS